MKSNDGRILPNHENVAASVTRPQNHRCRSRRWELTQPTGFHVCQLWLLGFFFFPFPDFEINFTFFLLKLTEHSYIKNSTLKKAVGSKEEAGRSDRSPFYSPRETLWPWIGSHWIDPSLLIRMPKTSISHSPHLILMSRTKLKQILTFKYLIFTKPLQVSGANSIPIFHMRKRRLPKISD